MTEAMTNIGVISNMKEVLTRSNLKVRDRQLISMALKQLYRNYDPGGDSGTGKRGIFGSI